MKRILSLITAACMLATLGTTVTAAFAKPATPLQDTPALPKTSTYAELEAQRVAHPLHEGYLGTLQSFSYSSASKLLTGQATNTMYAPVSLHMALSLTATGTKGQTRAELLDALGFKADASDESIAKYNNNLFQNLYIDGKEGALLLANSLWLRQGEALNTTFTKRAAESFYATARAVAFGTKAANQQISEWISTQTKGKLTPQIQTDAATYLTILNTVYYKDAWQDQFETSQTASAPFYLADGKTQSCDFMSQKISGAYWKGFGYTRVTLPMASGATFSFILPDAQMSLDNLLATPESVAALFTDENRQYSEIIYHIPKFGFDSKLAPIETLVKMGITSAFDSTQADFSALSKTKNLYISDITQETRIDIDEHGAEAAAYTEIMVMESALMLDPTPPLDFNLNRPFLFAVHSAEGVPLFIGTVQNPAA